MCCLKCCHRSGVMTREETKQLAHENVSEGFLECMGRDAHVSTCCTAHRRMAHDGQKSPQQRTTSCHIVSYQFISCLFMSIPVSCFGSNHCGIIWHWTSLSSFADVGPCYSSIMHEIRRNDVRKECRIPAA